jgi:hypothetical protein
MANMSSKSLNARIANEHAAMRAYEDEAQVDSVLGLDELQERIMKAQAIANDLLNRAIRVTDRMYGESAGEAGGESLKSSPYGMVQILNSQVGDLISTLGDLDTYMRRIAQL